MLLTENYMKSIEEQLNAGQTNVVFKLYDNLGNFMDAYRKSNSVVDSVQGIFSLAPSVLTPIKNLNIAVISARLELEVDIDTVPPVVTDDGDIIEYPLVRTVRDIWDSFAEANNGIPIKLQDNDGKSYSVTPSYSLMSTGVIEMLGSDTGEVMTLATTMSFTVVENGINTNNLDIYINGENIMFGQAIITRNRVADSATYVDNSTEYNANKTIIQQNGIGIDLNIPLLDSRVGRQIWDDILLGGNNKAYSVAVIKNKIPEAYIMTTGTNSIGMIPAENISARISLVEIPPHIAKFDSRWTIESFSGSTYSESGNYPTGTTIIWGDGMSEVLFYDHSQIVHSYSSAGQRTIYIYVPTTR